MVVTSGQRWHATVVVPQGWSQAQAEVLSRLFVLVSNPSVRKGS
jgi:hypothetical protein